MKTYWQHSEKSIELMNMAVVLLVIFPLLFVFLGLSRSLAERQQPREEGEKSPPAEPEPPPDPCAACASLAHDQPPIIVLSEAEGFSFATGKAEISPEFHTALRENIIPQLVRLGREYNCNVIDCIGHTDEQQVFGTSTLDTALLAWIRGETATSLVAGSNADLGLMRCWEVIQFLKWDGRLGDFTLYGYSAGQTVLPSGAIAQPGQWPKDDATRRRIELRLRRFPRKALAVVGPALLAVVGSENHIR